MCDKIYDDSNLCEYYQLAVFGQVIWCDSSAALRQSIMPRLYRTDGEKDIIGEKKVYGKIGGSYGNLTE